VATLYNKVDLHIRYKNECFAVKHQMSVIYSSGWILSDDEQDAIAYSMDEEMREPYAYTEDGEINNEVFGGNGTVSNIAALKDIVVFKFPNDQQDEDVEVEIMYNHSLEEEACSTKLNKSFKRLYDYDLYGPVLIFAYRKTGDKQTPVLFALRI
tara:strand:+ start:249 stop:710 length:462 start_codon:yes stop_codon:yes gene_type:complete